MIEMYRSMMDLITIFYGIYSTDEAFNTLKMAS